MGEETEFSLARGRGSTSGGDVLCALVYVRLN